MSQPGAEKEIRCALRAARQTATLLWLASINPSRTPSQRALLEAELMVARAAVKRLRSLYLAARETTEAIHAQ